jgi:hypothetical protein
MGKIELSWNDHIFYVKTVDELYDKVYEVLPFTQPFSGKDFFKVKIQDGQLRVGIQNSGNGMYLARISHSAKDLSKNIFGTQAQILHGLMAAIDEVTPKTVYGGTVNMKVDGNEVGLKIGTEVQVSMPGAQNRKYTYKVFRNWKPGDEK